MSRPVCIYNGEYAADTVKALCEGLCVQPLAARALIRRGLTDVEEAKRFFHPEAAPLGDPFNMTDMQVAVERLRNAFLSDERICVYGDYDADGICATAILIDCFSQYTTLAEAYIPSRHTEGYGLHEDAVRRLHERGVTLIVTVDNGVSAVEEIALCRELGMDVIVTDHHSRPERLPDCAALVTPPDGACGAGVALGLARALFGDGRLDHWLPLAALATVADVVPLMGDNRVLVARGLPLIEENTGLRALLRVAGSSNSAADETTLAFLLAPRLNAAGRLGDAMRGVTLLLTEEPYTAEALACELNEANAQRRAIEAAILAQAEAMLAESAQEDRTAVLLRHREWNAGVIGIVASRLAEKLHCPVILFSEDAEGVLTGSGRSAGNIDLYEALSACAAHFIRFGGHSGAAGVTMHADSFNAFCVQFRRYLAEHYKSEDFQPTLYYDETLALGELTLSAVSELRLLAPFGEGNPEPVYRLCNIRLSELRRMGQDGKHISARASDAGASLRAVGFGFGERFAELAEPGSRTLFVRPSVNAYRGMESVELLLSDVCGEKKLFDDFFRNVLYNSICVESFDLPHACDGEGNALDGAAMRRQYVGLASGIGPAGQTVDTLLSKHSRDELCALLVFLELGFFIHDDGVIRHAAGAEKRALSESSLYRRLRSKD